MQAGHLKVKGYVGHGYLQLKKGITYNKHVILLFKVLLVKLKQYILNYFFQNVYIGSIVTMCSLSFDVPQVHIAWVQI